MEFPQKSVGCIAAYTYGDYVYFKNMTDTPNGHTGSRRGDTGANRDLERRPRAEIHRVQDVRWRLVGMYACLYRRSMTGMRVKNRVQRAVRISLRMADGRESWYTKGEGEVSRKQLSGGTRIDKT